MSVSCPHCGETESRIIESRTVIEACPKATFIRKRRHICDGCSLRYTSLNNLIALTSGINKGQYQLALHKLQGTTDAT